MKVIRFVLLVCAVLFALPTNSQVLRTGLLVGGGLGFEHNLTPNSGRPDIWQEGDYKIGYKDKYQFGASLGYRFRIEHGKMIGCFMTWTLYSMRKYLRTQSLIMWIMSWQVGL